ncbi:heme-binding protein [Planobacterium oryzisoli]|uniref:Heme-binding protein n=1 Tax=Planobacterium oryzisoli TaxID=2771435 RepID=A0A930YU87_9FLAO|nr:heme-binding protein [Planobacterium oryzisoli]MBF5026457.1 heme-binding protein [Planobacterium oryzisoli]
MNIIKVYLPTFLFLISTWSFAQKGSENSSVRTISNLTSKGALQVAEHTIQNAALQGKTITVVVVDASGTVIVVIKGDGVGPHNTQASEKKTLPLYQPKLRRLPFLEEHSSIVTR